MSQFKEAIRGGMEDYLDAMKRAVDGLTPAETRWQASMASNHIDWLVWHIGRVEDNWMNNFMGDGVQVWVGQGWSEKFGIAVDGSGFGQTADDVRALPAVPMSDLLDYMSAVRTKSFAVLDGLEEKDLDATIDHPRMKNITGRWVLGHLLVEESQHVGQIAFIRGLLRGFGG